MTDYTPSEEQIEALARDDYAQWGGKEGLLGDDMETWIAEARAVVGYPAFQSIIRAAQADVYASLTAHYYRADKNYYALSPNTPLWLAAKKEAADV